MDKVDLAILGAIVVVGAVGCSIKANAGEVGVLLGSVSKHHTTKHAPASGYNENHRTLGIEYIHSSCGGTLGASVARGRDSFNKRMVWLMATSEYNRCFNAFTVGGGVGVGHLGTSYYNGVFGMVYGKIKHNKTGLYSKVMHQPISNNRVDSFTAVTGGVSKKVDFNKYLEKVF